jgi:hypothetical protein
LAHRAAAAFFALALRSVADSLAALALPPFSPPSLPSATAAAFFVSLWFIAMAHLTHGMRAF